MADLIRKKAKENQKASGEQYGKGCLKSDKPIEKISQPERSSSSNNKRRSRPPYDVGKLKTAAYRRPHHRRMGQTLLGT